MGYIKATLKDNKDNLVIIIDRIFLLTDEQTTHKWILSQF